MVLIISMGSLGIELWYDSVDNCVFNGASFFISVESFDLKGLG